MLLLLSTTVLGIYSRAELAMVSRVGVDPISTIVLDSGLNWRLLLFVVLPIFLVTVARDVDRVVEPQALIRLGSYYRWALFGLASAASRAMPLVACIVAPAIAIGIGGFAPASWTRGTSIVLGAGNQVLVACITVVSVTVNLSLLGLFVLLGRLTLGPAGGIVAAAIIFSVSILSSASPFALASLNIGYGIQPASSAEYFGSWALGLACPTMSNTLILAIFVASLELRDRRVGWRRLLWLWVVATVIILRFATGDWQNPAEALAGGYYGTGGTILDYLFVAIVALAPAWVAGTFADPKYDGLQYGLVRAGSLYYWLWRVYLPYLLLVPAYFVAVTAGSVGVLWVRFAGGLTSSFDAPLDLREVGYHLVVNGTLQGWAFVVAVALTRLLAGAPWGALAALGAIFAGGAIAPNSYWFVLVDLGTGHIFEGGNASLISTVLLASLVGLVGLGLACMKRWRAAILERNISV
ncbi:hypothetical protein [Micropruina sp.]|uniref:hypothetical protein n=1 Tax=Micropruina sp. TaxID=2737536 RepID=UPI0039E5BAB0